MLALRLAEAGQMTVACPVSDSDAPVGGRNPGYSNLLGFDIDQVDASPLFGNNVTATTLTLTTATGLSYQMPDMSSPNVRSVEVYDWQAHAWRALPKQQVSARNQGPAALHAGELAQGIVRVRVVEGFATNGANLAVGDLPQ